MESVKVSQLNIKVVKMNRNDIFRTTAGTFFFKGGWGFYAEGRGFLGFKTTDAPYVLSTKKWAQSIIDAGGFTSLDNMDFYNAVTL